MKEKICLKILERIFGPTEKEWEKTSELISQFSTESYEWLIQNFVIECLKYLNKEEKSCIFYEDKERLFFSPVAVVYEVILDSFTLLIESILEEEETERVDELIWKKYNKARNSVYIVVNKENEVYYECTANLKQFLIDMNLFDIEEIKKYVNYGSLETVEWFFKQL